MPEACRRLHTVPSLRYNIYRGADNWCRRPPLFLTMLRKSLILLNVAGPYWLRRLRVASSQDSLSVRPKNYLSLL